MKTDRGVSHFGKRVRQTVTTYRNFPRVFLDLALAETKWRPDEVTYRMRNGLTVVTPNADGARFPLYEIFADDAYRLDELTAGVDKDAAVLDVGGQIGSFSLAMSGALPEARIHVYEASPTSAGYVSRNVEANDLGSRVTVHACAMAGEVGTFTFVDSGDASGHNGLTAPEGLGDEVTVPATTFDEAVKDAGGQVQIVKMDVEGAEYDIILRSDPASWADVRKVVMEYHPVEGHSLEELTDFFAAVGITPDGTSRAPAPGSASCGCPGRPDGRGNRGRPGHRPDPCQPGPRARQADGPRRAPPGRPRPVPRPLHASAGPDPRHLRDRHDPRHRRQRRSVRLDGPPGRLRRPDHQLRAADRRLPRARGPGQARRQVDAGADRGRQRDRARPRSTSPPTRSRHRCAR